MDDIPFRYISSNVYAIHLTPQGHSWSWAYIHGQQREDTRMNSSWITICGWQVCSSVMTLATCWCMDFTHACWWDGWVTACWLCRDQISHFSVLGFFVYWSCNSAFFMLQFGGFVWLLTFYPAAVSVLMHSVGKHLSEGLLVTKVLRILDD